MKNKQHLILVGLSKIIRASINKGLSETLSVNYPNTIPAVKPCVEPISILNPKILTGFPSAEGCFKISINKSKPPLQMPMPDCNRPPSLAFEHRANVHLSIGQMEGVSGKWR